MFSALSTLDQLEIYTRRFTDVDFFRPAVEEVARRHGLGPCPHIRVGIPGTCPVFIVEERYLVKFFGRLFEGGQAFAAEQAAARLLGGCPGIPSAAVLAAGQLLPESPAWPWPYLVFAYVPAASLGEQRARLSLAGRLALARELGGWLRQLHSLSLPPAGPFALDWRPHLAFLAAQRQGCAARHAAWGHLPARLMSQVEGFLAWPEELLLPGELPHLIHADLTQDHLLGRVEQGAWTSQALIDFGDAHTGGLFYELSALHLGLFAAERELLAAFLSAYGYTGPHGADFARRAMSCALIHRFDVLDLLDQRPDLRSLHTLQALAAQLWQVD